MMSNKTATILLAAVVVLLGLAAPAAAQQAPDRAIRTMLEQRDRQIKQILGTSGAVPEGSRERLRDLVNGVIDFEAMSRLALGEHWADLSARQRQEFVEVFSDIVRAQSLANLDVYRAVVSYKRITVEGDSAHVVTSTVYKDVPADVEYVLGLRDGEWYVHDIVLDAVSTAGGYARSFQTVIRRKGFDALMTSLEKKREKMM